MVWRSIVTFFAICVSLCFTLSAHAESELKNTSSRSIGVGYWGQALITSIYAGEKIHTGGPLSAKSMYIQGMMNFLLQKCPKLYHPILILIAPTSGGMSLGTMKADEVTGSIAVGRDDIYEFLSKYSCTEPTTIRMFNNLLNIYKPGLGRVTNESSSIPNWARTKKKKRSNDAPLSRERVDGMNPGTMAKSGYGMSGRQKKAFEDAKARGHKVLNCQYGPFDEFGYEYEYLFFWYKTSPFTEKQWNEHGIGNYFKRPGTWQPLLHCPSTVSEAKRISASVRK